MYSRILVAYDGSEGSKRALKSGLALGKRLGSEVCVLSVEGKLPRYAATLGEVQEVEQERAEYYETIQREAREIAAHEGAMVKMTVAPGAPAETIVKTAKEGDYDLIVMGHKGHSRMHNYLVGATTDRVAHLAPCAVLIVP